MRPPAKLLEREAATPDAVPLVADGPGAIKPVFLSRCRYRRSDLFTLFSAQTKGAFLGPNYARAQTVTSRLGALQDENLPPTRLGV